MSPTPKTYAGFLIINFKELESAPFSPRSDQKSVMMSDSTAIFIGGEKKGSPSQEFDDIYKWNPLLGEWSRFDKSFNWFNAGNSFSAAIHNDRLYIYGGVGSNGLYPYFAISSPLENSDSIPLDNGNYSLDECESTVNLPSDKNITFEIKDLREDPNSPLTKTSDGFFGNAQAIWSDGTTSYLVSVFGNEAFQTDKPLEQKTTRISAYNFTTQKWENWGELSKETHISGEAPNHGGPCKRYCPLYCVYGDHLYILGGRQSKAEQHHVYKDMWRYNLKEKTWEQLHKFVNCHISLVYKAVQSVLIGQYWYIISYHTPSIISRYNILSNEFEEVGVLLDFPLKGRYILNYFPSIPNKIYAIGGYNDNENQPTNKIYEISLPEIISEDKQIQQKLSETFAFGDLAFGDVEFKHSE